MEENELIKQFIRDLYYIDDIEKGTHVFERITKVIEKWEKYISQDKSEAKDNSIKQLLDKDYSQKGRSG